ncbi:MAG: hypothetical protein ACYTGL_10840 [Planctomycetota bacterium]|jgi:hypothetical protein
MTEQTTANRQELSPVKLIILIFCIALAASLAGAGCATLGESLGGVVGSWVGLVVSLLFLIAICWAATRRFYHPFLPMMLAILIIAGAMRVGEQIGLHYGESGGRWGSGIAFGSGLVIFFLLTRRPQTIEQSAETSGT